VRAQAPGVPIVVLTGFQDEAVADQAMKEGAQDYLVKEQAESKLLARSLRYAIARKVAEDALIRQGVAIAKAADLQRSRHRLLAVPGVWTFPPSSQRQRRASYQPGPTAQVWSLDIFG